MLFNSYIFLFLFLPLTFLGYRVALRQGQRSALGFLVVASLTFYGYWNPRYVGLIAGSIVFNYLFGGLQRRTRLAHEKPSRKLLWFGIAANLLLLGYYKYARFFVETTNQLAGTAFKLNEIVLPLAISFFTFTQIAYLVDEYDGMSCEYTFLDYCFFVLFFPHLIAGPIVRHHEILPQVKRRLSPNLDQVAVGCTMFIMGLFKKVVLADAVGPHATKVFSAAASGENPNFLLAWGGALAYSLQLYFDFSGYSDMAIGLGAMFGVRMPLNFNSPYKAHSITDFWRRWHISLSRFLRDYLYIRLGGNRKGPARRYANLILTMLLGGLWHGAGLTFIAWGALHGLYLLINHAWSAATKGCAWAATAPMRVSYRFLTLLAIIVGWVFFRADSFATAWRLLRGMIGMNGIILPPVLKRLAGESPISGVSFGLFGFGAGATVLVLVLGVIALFAPNSQEILCKARPAIEEPEACAPIAWKPTIKWAILLGVACGTAIVSMGRVSEFLYFQF